MDIEKIKSLVKKNKDLVLKAERDLWKIPEIGFKEYKTNAYMKEKFKELGYSFTEADGITGFFTTVDTGREGPTVLILAELDALYCATHPECDKETHAVHACGHHAQLAAMLGLASTLKEEGALDGLSGKIKLCVVPAEEGVDIQYRFGLLKKGVISFTSGKPEFLSRGYFDDVDIAFMTHARMTDDPKKLFTLVQGMNGVIKKKMVIKGKAAHAGEHPYDGVNALNAAMLAISAVNSLRETFKECDSIRFHPIVTKGGEAVNTVPDEVILETFVRASNPAALFAVNKRINRAISAAVAANGCTVVISDIGGSEPLNDDKNFAAFCADIIEEIGGKDCLDDARDVRLGGSTDMGDMSVNFPSVHAWVFGAKGTLHGSDFSVAEPEKLCVNAAILEFAVVRRLLENGAEKAKEIIENFKPVYPSIRDYVAHKKSQNVERETVIQNEDGSITII
ncbi:MAG: amidohydrolase [Clostridia bacterium]|nr:amidohydrolase [Clostridia bacterium]